MKKIIITTIVALMCASNVCAESIDNNTFITDTVCSSSDNTRASDYINTYALSINSNSTGTVTVTSNMTCKPTVSKCKITVKLKKYNGSTYVLYSTKTTTTNGTSGICNKTFSVTSGQKYRADVTFQALDSSGNVLDSRSAISSTVTAK